MTTTENNKRIAQNTLLLYFRMFLIMAVTLYTSRVILKTLGIEDFGIYNVIAGIIVLFAFINNAMATTTQRYLSIALGHNNLNEVERVFSMSLNSHIAIAGIIFIIGETLGLWLLGKMNFPENRLNAAHWVYQFSMMTCCMQVIRVPYNSIIIAHEKMSFYAWTSIIEVVLKLVIVFFLILYDFDKLILYSILLFIVTSLINIIYKIYCNKYFIYSKYHFSWDKKLFKEFIAFSGWSLAGSLANVGTQQGINMIINIFCGVVVNAAVGISNQVMGAVSQFLYNFQTAFNPQLLKSYANGNREYFMNLIFKSSKFSYYLMFIISLPIIINCHFLLTIWLDEVPKYSTEFSILMIIFLLFDALSGPLWISVQATGKIKKYQLLMAFLILLNLPIALLLMYLNLSPIYIYIVRVVLNALTFFTRTLYLYKLIQFPLHQYISKVLYQCIIITLLSLPIPILCNYILPTTWSSVSINIFICIIISCYIIYRLGLNKNEKNFIVQTINNKISKITNKG